MFMYLFMHDISSLKISLQNLVKGTEFSKFYVTKYKYVLRVYNIDDLPLLLARSSKALTFARLAISLRGLYCNDCSTKLLCMYYARNFYTLCSAIS